MTGHDIEASRQAIYDALGFARYASSRADQLSGNGTGTRPRPGSPTVRSPRKATGIARILLTERGSTSARDARSKLGQQ
jgi:hypothetical protein